MFGIKPKVTTYWKIVYEINGSIYDTVVSDNSSSRGLDYSRSSFEEHIRDTHQGISLDDVDVIDVKPHTKCWLARFF